MNSILIDIMIGYVTGMSDCPSSTPFFIGRQMILNELDKYFIQGKTSVEIQETKTFLLHGPGGAGKTQCALRFAKLFKRKYVHQFVY